MTPAAYFTATTNSSPYCPEYVRPVLLPNMPQPALHSLQKQLALLPVLSWRASSALNLTGAHAAGGACDELQACWP